MRNALRRRLRFSSFRILRCIPAQGNGDMAAEAAVTHLRLGFEGVWLGLRSEGGERFVSTVKIDRTRPGRRPRARPKLP